LAERVGADPATVSRWITDDTRTPHARTRWAVADVLGVDEVDLWPNAVRATIKRGPEREIVNVYLSRAAVPGTMWADMISAATETIVFAGYTSYFAWLAIPDLRATLRGKAEAGCSVRFLVGDPDSDITRRREEVEGVALTVRTRIAVTLDELEHLRDAPGVEARKSDRHISLSVFIFDGQALVCQHLGAGLGHDSLTWQLRRRQPGGLFDRFAQHVDALWQVAAPVWP